MHTSSYFRKYIFLPQEHGSWVFILSPLIIGIFVGGRFNLALFSLIIAAMAAFLVRQPVTIAVKAYFGRRPKSDLAGAYLWVAIYSIIILFALTALLCMGLGYILYLALPGMPVFAWHLWLVSRREERNQAGVEIVATGVLSLAAPAAYWVGMGRYDPIGWWLWMLTWLQSAASIVYAYLRLEQRNLSKTSTLNERSKRGGSREMWKMEARALAYTTFNFAASLTLGLASVLPRLIFIPYLVQWAETIWGILHPAAGWKPTRIGIRQLIVSTLWTILFIIAWRI